MIESAAAPVGPIPKIHLPDSMAKFQDLTPLREDKLLASVYEAAVLFRST